MEIEQNISKVTFLDIIKIGLIRKKILWKLPTFYDLSSLAKTCQLLNVLIYHDKIKRQMFRYFDKHCILIKTEEFEETSNIQNIDNIKFLKEVEFCEELDKAQKFNGETIIFRNEITIKIINSLEDINTDKNELFINKLIVEFKFNCHSRKDATNLEFKIEDISVSQNNHNIILYIISHMNHQNIKCIKIPDTVFMSTVNKYNNLKSNLFDGFPKFHELIISVPHIQSGFKEFMKNKYVFKRIIDELSKRKNATLILKCYSDEYNVFINLAHMIREMTRNYKIKIKCDVGHIIPFLEKKRNIICSSTRCILFPIEELVTSFFNYVDTFSMFMCTMKNLKCFKNLEKMELRLSSFNIKQEIEETHIFNCNIFSLKHCNKLKKIKIEFLGNFKQRDELNVEVLHNNLIIIASLMPTSIEKLELWNVPDLSKNVLAILNEHMPNIKVLVNWDVTYKDYDCLSIFKNLQAYISYQNIPIQIPTTIKLLAIGNTNFLEDDDKNKCMLQELLKSYSDKFSKRVQTSQDRYIFFNDVRQWKKYKHLFQKNFYFFC